MTHPEIPTSIRVAVAQRDGGRCLRCGGGGDTHLHHRQRRRDGGHHLANLVTLCRFCHVWAHGHPHQARHEGYIVSAFTRDVSAVPMRWVDGGLVRLDDDGGVTWALEPGQERPETA